MQYNDETVTNVDLTLGDEVISCRGASSDAAAPAGVVPGVAESGGSVEIECFFDTDQVAGECMGMQMSPRFANGEHELGAQITTADGTVRQALATQMITLKNSNYVMIDHNPGSVSKVVQGVTYYGGPTTEDNVNTFDVCPVAFDGTMVGSIKLRGMTDTKAADGSAGTSLSFRAHQAVQSLWRVLGRPRARMTRLRSRSRPTRTGTAETASRPASGTTAGLRTSPTMRTAVTGSSRTA